MSELKKSISVLVIMLSIVLLAIIYFGIIFYIIYCIFSVLLTHNRITKAWLKLKSENQSFHVIPDWFMALVVLLLVSPLFLPRMIQTKIEFLLINIYAWAKLTKAKIKYSYIPIVLLIIKDYTKINVYDRYNKYLKKQLINDIFILLKNALIEQSKQGNNINI